MSSKDAVNDWSDLTAAEQALTTVMINIDFVGSSITTKCEEAGVSRGTYYIMVKRPGYLEFLNRLVEKTIGDHLYEVSQATFKYALDERGHQDRKLILQMFGKLVDQISVKLPQFIEDLPESDD